MLGFCGSPGGLRSNGNVTMTQFHIQRCTQVVEGSALEILRVEWNRRGWEALKTLGILELGGQRFGRVLIEILRIIK